MNARSLAVVRDFGRTAVESGKRWDRRHLATVSSWFQSATAFFSSSVGLFGSAATGQTEVLVKWSHFWFASIASWRRRLKIAQLEPVGSRRGTEVGRGSFIAAGRAGPITSYGVGTLGIIIEWLE